MSIFMSIFRLLLLILCIFSVNVFASEAHFGSDSRMCVSAYLAKPIHKGDITFFVKNQPIGNISIYGAWLDIVSIVDYGYFKDQKDFEKKKAFLRVENTGEKLEVSKFTYQSC